ncbi:undecaprenyldiphospho-muramoylpentapeptide beta-N-acetylglucosaminyltransferase [Alteromonas sp. H39]|uniref:undecaprenyldiphospho-muramoylpentapeptide beta-N-acetylglucosaminyltransferase n=1 Tax=Alteromonas sp. H39 TaxID=3389876 RepID=UPI0039E04B94
MTKRCLIMAGGTGGHVFPGLAVADALKAKGWDIQWLGTAERMEAEVVPKRGYPISFLPVKGIRGKGLSAKIKGVMALIKSLYQARKLVQQIAPDLVIGFGGYASGPGGVAAWSSGIPVIVHEQNAAAGVTNKLLGKFAKCILLGFEDARSQFSGNKNIITVGNPVRDEIWQVKEKVSISTPLNMLVVGGSLGSRPLNETVPPVCAGLEGLTIRHQCGKGNVKDVERAYANANGSAEVTEFIDDMAQAYEWADFVVCRAGALTVSEIAAAGRAAIFVPLPHAVDDHQTKNAQALVKAKAALMIPQSLLKENLGQAVRQWISDPQACLKMGRMAREQAQSKATEQVVAQCEALAGEAA